MKTLYVVNPNSSVKVTSVIDRAVQSLRIPGVLDIVCETLDEGPAGIESQRDIDYLVPHLCRRVQSLEDQAAGFVVACFSDPGLYSVREITKKPVLGIAESGVLTALSMGQKFGVISILERSIPRHLRYFGAMGVTDRLAADLAINMGVAELADYDKTLARMTDVGHALKHQHQADVIVMGCAGMGDMREPLQQALGIPVIEPSQAAVAMAMGRVLLNW